MPFWWGRRKRWWRPTRYYRKRRTYRRRPRKTIFRRRHRRAPRRRTKRRRTKVRRKKKFLKLLQWQPQSIRKCKIIGVETLILGANGKQFRDYTSTMNDWVPATVPGGGGFSISRYTLEYLYEQNTYHNNIWTHSNESYDLCRYTGAKFTFYRHQHTDFIVHYQREYPMSEGSLTPMQTHPLILLQQRKKILIPSKLTKPHGKNYIKIKVKPPRQQTNKWFFIRDFARTPLLLFKSTACDFNYVRMAKTSENNQTNILCLNYMFYSNGQFSQGTGTHNYYSPQVTWTANDNWITYQNGGKSITQKFMKTYLDSVSYTNGWFTPAILNAEKLTDPPSETPRIYTVRYNPNIDTGQGNRIWLKSKFKHDWSPPQTESYLILADEPLWLLFFGWLDYINTLKPAYHIFEDYLVVIESPYFKQPFLQPQKYIVPIDESFTQGKGPYNSTPYLDKNKTWIPSLKHQQQSINNIVKCGPYVTKPEGKYSNWELHLKYTFFFKWGGAQPPAADIYNPTQGSTYPVPDHYQQRIQIKDPTKVIPQTILHTWDYRRGDITKKALKRMYDYLSDATTVSTDSEFQEPLQKTKKSARQVLGEDKNKDTLECLQKLYEEDSSPKEEKTHSIEDLIQQQRQQQHDIKHNLLKLLTKLKHAQLQMQLQTGTL
nr:MAG: ORF1 [Torque teno midi virus]